MSRHTDFQMLNIFNDLIARARNRSGQPDKDPNAGASSGQAGDLPKTTDASASAEQADGPRQPLDSRPNRRNANLDSTVVNKALASHSPAAGTGSSTSLRDDGAGASAAHAGKSYARRGGAMEVKGFSQVDSDAEPEFTAEKAAELADQVGPDDQPLFTDEEAAELGDETNDGPRQPLGGRPNRHNVGLDSTVVDKAVDDHQAAENDANDITAKLVTMTPEDAAADILRPDPDEISLVPENAAGDGAEAEVQIDPDDLAAMEDELPPGPVGPDESLKDPPADGFQAAAQRTAELTRRLGGKEEFDKVMEAHEFVLAYKKYRPAVLGNALPGMQDDHRWLQFEYQRQMDVLREAKKKGYKVDLDEFPERLPDLHETGGGEPTIAEYLAFGALLYGGVGAIKAAAPYVGPALKALQGLAVRSGPLLTSKAQTLLPKAIAAASAGAKLGREFYDKANVLLMRLEVDYPQLMEFARGFIDDNTPKDVPASTKMAALAHLLTTLIEHTIAGSDPVYSKTMELGDRIASEHLNQPGKDAKGGSRSSR